MRRFPSRESKGARRSKLTNPQPTNRPVNNSKKNKKYKTNLFLYLGDGKKNNMMSVGKNIKKLRELKNYTQSYMASQLDMSVSGYSKIEKDRTDISLSKIEKIAEILETSLSTILNFDPKQIFNQYDNHNSVVSGVVTNQNLGGNITQILRNIQTEISSLKEKMSNKKS